jgi:hypothetical protein
MKITAESELMVNQKHATLLGPQNVFQVLQTEEGDSLFFSIASTGAFYVTRELRGSKTGWDKIELSASLGIPNGKIKTFAAAQNPSNLRVDLAIVVTADGHDTLYTSFENQHTAAGWEQNVKWSKISFDADLTSPSSVQIENVNLLSIPSSTGDLVSCFVDVLREPTSSLKILDRYYIRLLQSPHWVRNRLPHDVEAGSIASCLGRRENERVAGIYSFGTLAGNKSLLYTPERNARHPETAPLASRLNLPEGATSIASSTNPTGDSSLFVAAEKGLYVFAPNNQRDNASPELVIPSSPIKGTNTFAAASQLQAVSAKSRTVVWGLRSNGDLVYASCQGGQEANQKAWSHPMRLTKGVNAFTFYLNVGQTGNTLFVQTKEQRLLQYGEDHGSGEWSSSPITLPPMDSDEMLEQHTFTSHVQINKDDGMPASKQSVELHSPQTISVYVNDIYLKISPERPVEAETNATGALTVIQLTDSIAATCIQIICEDQLYNIDPQAKARKTLRGVRTGDDLSKIEIKDSKGNMSPLVPSDVSAKSRDDIATALNRLLDVQSTLPVDGSKKQPKAGVKKASSLGWGAICGSDRFDIYESGLDVHSTQIFDSIEVCMGALFNFLKDAWTDVTKIVVDVFDGVHRFFVWIGDKVYGDKVYETVLDTIEAVSKAIEVVFTQIKVGFEKLAAWVGFMFSWDDILRTHRVFKNMSLQYARHSINQIGVLAKDLQAGFETAKESVNRWAQIQLPDSGKTIGEQKGSGNDKQKGSGNDTGTEMKSPQNNWASYHASNGLGGATTPAKLPGPDISGLEGLFEELKEAVNKEEEEINNMIQLIKTEVAQNFMILSPEQIIQKTIAIVANFVIGSAENLCLRFLKIVEKILHGLLDLLVAPIDIPLLSWLYKNTITDGDELSALDLACLVAAIPATLMFKAVTNRNPFPDSNHTKALIAATNFDTITQLLSESQGKSSNLIAVDKEVTAEVKPTTGDTVVACLKLSSYSINGLNAGLSILKHTGLDKTATPIRAISICFWFAANLPGIIDRHLAKKRTWTLKMSTLLNILSCAKCLADNTPIYLLGPVEELWGVASPVVGSILGIVSFVPPIASVYDKESLTAVETFGLSSALCSSTSGMLAVLTSKYIEPDTRLISIFLSTALTVASGELTTIGAITFLLSTIKNIKPAKKEKE